MRWAGTTKAKGLPLDAINIFPLFSFPRMLRTDLFILLYILSAPAPWEDFGAPWIYVLCWGRTQLSWLVTDPEIKSLSGTLLPADLSKMVFVLSYLSLEYFWFFSFFLFILFWFHWFFFLHRRWPPKWLLLLLLYYHAWFLLCYLVHLPASYLARRYMCLWSDILWFLQ